MNRQDKAMERSTQAYGWMGASELPSRILRASVSRRIGEFLMVTGVLASMSVLTVGTIVLLAVTVAEATAM